VTPIRFLIMDAGQAGLTLRLDGERLVIRGPKQADALARAILARKLEALEYLAHACRRCYCPLYAPASQPRALCISCERQP
jgi:hypothetical protein